MRSLLPSSSDGSRILKRYIVESNIKEIFSYISVQFYCKYEKKRGFGSAVGMKRGVITEKFNQKKQIW